MMPRRTRDTGVAAADGASPATGGLRRHAEELGRASERLATVGWETDTEAERTAGQADGVSEAAEATAGNVGSVAVAVEQMGMSIQEISRNTAEAASISEAAEREAQTAAERIQRLGRVSERAASDVLRPKCANNSLREEGDATRKCGIDCPRIRRKTEFRRLPLPLSSAHPWTRAARSGTSRICSPAGSPAPTRSSSRAGSRT